MTEKTGTWRGCILFCILLNMFENLSFLLRGCIECKPPIWSHTLSMGTVLCFQWAFHLSSHSLFFLLYPVMISSTDTGTIFHRLTEQFKECSLHGIHNNKQASFSSFGSLSFRKPSKVMSRFPITTSSLLTETLWKDENVMRYRITRVNGTLWEWGDQEHSRRKVFEELQDKQSHYNHINNLITMVLTEKLLLTGTCPVEHHCCSFKVALLPFIPVNYPSSLHCPLCMRNISGFAHVSFSLGRPSM